MGGGGGEGGWGGHGGHDSVDAVGFQNQLAKPGGTESLKQRMEQLV